MYIPIKSKVRYHNISWEETPNLKRLFNEISKYKSLSKDKEKELITLAKAGNLKAKDEVIYSNMKFAISVAKKYANKNQPFEDYISEALIGLLEAFEDYDMTKEVRFITYAVFHIQKRLSFMQQRIIKLPNSYRLLRGKINKAQESLSQLYCGDIPTSYLEYHLELKENQISNYLYETISLDEWFEKYEEELL